MKLANRIKTMSILQDVIEQKKSIGDISTYSNSVRVPAAMLFNQPKAPSLIAMEDFNNKNSGLGEELKSRQESLRFVLKEMKNDVLKVITFDSLLTKRLSKIPYSSLMDIEMLNPMGLRAPLLDYATVLLEATEISKLIIGKVLPGTKIFFSELVGNDELMNQRPVDSYSFLSLNEEPIAELKQKLAKMLDSAYENPITNFGSQFKRFKDWEDTHAITKAISVNLNDITKYDLEKEIKTISGILDKLVIKVKTAAERKEISSNNITLVRVATRQIAEEISFLGAVVHLGDTFVKVMEDNKEFLRDYVNK